MQEPFAYENEKSFERSFLPIDSFVRISAFVALLVLTFALTFVVIPFEQFRIHFFQAGIFLTGFIFGPAAGALVGGLSSSYNGLAVIHNPWIILGNVILGFFAARFYVKMGALKGAMAAYAIQLPYLVFTDVVFAGMPLVAVGIIALTLFAENLICAVVVGSLAPKVKNLLLVK